MSKVFETYAQRKGVQSASLRFLLDGERIEPDQTPKMLELEDQDQIDHSGAVLQRLVGEFRHPQLIEDVAHSRDPARV